MSEPLKLLMKQPGKRTRERVGEFEVTSSRPCKADLP